jgi:LmbE family N-acetylglucosaminyl deacetylase
MTRILVLGAHPDDAEFFAGGLLARHAQSGSQIKLVSVTNGQSGHQTIPSDELVQVRRREAKRAGEVLGAEYVTWDFPDGSLTPSIEVRQAVIREIRQFQPDLVLTHRPFDYHPDHRAVGQVVQDASYMVLVPKVLPEVAPPTVEPVVAYMVDLFSRPCPFRPDAILDVSFELDTILNMMECHASQFYEWLPWIDRVLDTVPSQPELRRNWLQQWYLEKTSPRLSQFWKSENGPRPRIIEAYEVSEYAGKPSSAMLAKLFPGKRY